MSIPFWVSSSGLIGSFTAVFLILLPTFFVGLNYSKEPISFVVRERIPGIVFRIGLLSTSLLIEVNLFRMILTYQLEWLSIGTVLYGMGGVFMTLVALIDIIDNPTSILFAHYPLHRFCTRGYFLLTGIGSFFLSTAILPGWSLPLLIAIVGGIGTLLIYAKIGMKAQAEYYGISFCILWVLSFYIT